MLEDRGAKQVGLHKKAQPIEVKVYRYLSGSAEGGAPETPLPREKLQEFVESLKVRSHMFEHRCGYMSDREGGG